jgi:acetylornithine deacetylase/succinyl-diaminopimelate desuccinylase-like protein
LSPIFDAQWQENRNLFKQMDHLVNFAKKQGIKGAVIKPIEEPGRSPFLIVDVEASAGSGDKAPDYTVLMYGHMDKQPFGAGWETDPCDPVIKDGLMYGRGSVDDGYAFFTAVLSIKACQDLGYSHPRCLITIEGSEEGEM